MRFAIVSASLPSATSLEINAYGMALRPAAFLVVLVAFFVFMRRSFSALLGREIWYAPTRTRQMQRRQERYGTLFSTRPGAHVPPTEATPGLTMLFFCASQCTYQGR